MIDVSIDIGQVMGGVNAYLGRLSELHYLMEEIGLVEQKKAVERIKVLKLSPDDVPWLRLGAKRTVERIEDGTIEQGALWHTGALANSIQFQADKNGVEIGSSISYASNMFYGYNSPMYGDVPGRPYLGWSPTSRKEIEGLTTVFFKGLP